MTHYYISVHYTLQTKHARYEYTASIWQYVRAFGTNKTPTSFLHESSVKRESGLNKEELL